jgi:hypothetical protein
MKECEEGKLLHPFTVPIERVLLYANMAQEYPKNQRVWENQNVCSNHHQGEKQRRKLRWTAVRGMCVKI